MNEALDKTHAIAQLILSHKPQFQPRAGIVLGSGLGPLADKITDATTIPYASLPDFPKSTVQGHAGEIVLGYLNGVPVMCLKGRVHLYELPERAALRLLIRSLKFCGCEYMFATNAVGSLRPEFAPGSLVMVSDHINFQGTTPLMGHNESAIGPRFYPVDDAYDPKLRIQLREMANSLNIPLHEGVYIATLGPNFETPAEIRAFKILGADLVGMSTVPDVLIARHCGLRALVVSVVTNYAAGLSQGAITHEETLHHAALAGPQLIQLVTHAVAKLR